MNFETKIKRTIYNYFAETGSRPSPLEVAEHADSTVAQVLDIYPKLRAQRILVLETDGASIRMAPPFSGIPTQHLVIVNGTRYFANCAWDALGIVAALHRPGEIHSQCAQSGEPFQLKVNLDGPEPCSWLFHTLVPAAKWWADITFT